MSDELPEEDEAFEAFGAKFLNSTPEPSDDYWAKIDEAIQSSKRNSSADTIEQTVDRQPDSERDTEANVIRLKPMDKPRFDRNKILPAVAASLLLIAATVGVLQFLGSSRGKDDQVSTRTIDTRPEDAVVAETPTTQEPEITDETAPQDDIEEPDLLLGLEVGHYCYQLESDVGATGSVEIIVPETGPVSVSQRVDSGGREDPANVSAFDGGGTFTDETSLSVSGEQWIEGAFEPAVIRDDTWTVTVESVRIGSQTSTFVQGSPTYTLIPCELLPEPEEIPETDALAGLTIRVDEPLVFETGATSGDVRGAVIRGERDVYRVEVGAAQTMSVEITSVEDNAVFELVTPLGIIRNSEATSVDGIVTAPGVYLIIVGGTRGNATYDLTVTVN